MADIMKQWLKERDEAAKSYDVEKFKKFYNKYKALGIYNKTLPSDEVIEISMRKMVCNMSKATKEEVREATEWLTSRGYTTAIL